MAHADHKGAPVLTLKLGGTKLTDKHLAHVTSIELVESIEELDALTVQFAMPPVGYETIVDLCQLGGEYEIELGYGGSSARTGSGDIVEMSHTTSPGSPWTVTLRGMDCLHRLKASTTRSKKWEVSHDKIVNSIAGEHGFTTDVEAVEGTQTYTFQSGVSDAIFLRQLAMEHNYLLRVENKKLMFKRRHLAYGDKVTVEWGKDIEQVSLTACLDGLLTEVSVKGYDPAQAKTVEGNAPSSKIKGTSGGETGVSIVQAKFGDRKKHLDHEPYKDQSSCKGRALSELQSSAENFVKGSITCLGRPEAASGGKVEIKGLPWPFCGTFNIKQTKHTLEPGIGYRTTIEFFDSSLPTKS